MSKIEKALHKAAAQRREQTGRGPDEPREIAPLKSPVYARTPTRTGLSLDILDRERLLGGGQEAGLRDSVNLLRTQVLQKTRSMGWTTILVTSPNPHTGKTTIAANLAISLARELNHTALLVDICLHKPAVAKRLGLVETSGLSDYLLQQTPIENLLVNPGIDKLVVLPAGPPVGNSAELLGSASMKKLVAELKHRYTDRYIIFDAPHVVDMPDALIFAEYADAILLVLGDSETTTDELQKTIELLGNRNVLGIVLNKAR